jgi:hypothetical protein
MLALQEIWDHLSQNYVLLESHEETTEVLFGRFILTR